MNLNLRLSLFWGTWSAVLLITGLLLHRNLRKLSNSADWVAHSHEVLEASQCTLTTLMDAEAGQRGWFLTGNQRSLERFRSAVAKLQPGIVRLEGLVADNPQQEPRVRQLKGLVMARAGEMEAALGLGPERARQAVRENQQSGLMTSIRAAFDGMRDQEMALLAGREQANQQAYRTAILSGSILGLLGLAGMAGLSLQAIQANRERDRHERDLERQRGLLLVTLRSLGDGVITTDSAGRVDFLNPAAETLTGWTWPDAAGQPLESVFPGDHATLLRRDGTGIPVESNEAPILGDLGEAVGRVRVFRDVTARRQAEEALALSELRFRKLTELSPIAIWVNRNDHIELANPEAHRLMGASATDHLEGRSIFEIWHPDSHDKVRERLRAGSGGQVVHRSEERIVRLDGSVRTMEVSSAPFEDGKGFALQCVLVDVTERKQMIQAQRLEALGVLVAGVAHNFNNIMAIIMGTASMQEQLATDPGQLEALRIIDMACQRGRTLVRSLTHFARPSIPNQVPVELRGLLGELRDLLTNTARRNVAIVGAAAPEPVWIMGDPGSFNVAVMNLCLNGLDAMPEGGTLTIRTSIPDPDTVEVDVEDTGEGMTPEVLARVMEPFFTTKAVGKGTGLGLSVTHGVVAAHGGTLEILSRPGEGTRVKLRLPRLRKPVQAAPALPGKPASGLAKVLVVDDEQDVRELLAEMLAMAGATEVTGVPSGEDAIASLKRGEIPDLVILDHNMPGLDGARTLQLIRAEHPDLPVLVSSGEPEVEVRGGYDGMQVEFISKPFTFREIQEKLAGIGAGAERRTNDRRTSA